MPSGYSRNLGLELMLTGENAGTWGEVSNINLSAIDDAIDGVADITVVPGGITVTTANAPALSDGRSKVLTFTGTLSGSATVTFAPNDAEKHYFVRNLTAHPLVFAQGSGARYTVNGGYSAVIHCDGMGIEASVFGTLSSLQTDKLLVRTSAELQGSITIAGAITMKEPVTLEKSLTVTGAAQFSNNVGVTGTLTVIGASTLGPVAIASTLTVAGAAVMSDTLGVTGNAQINGTLRVQGAVTLDTTLNVTGATTLTALTAANVTATTGIGTPSLVVSGGTSLNALTVAGALTINTPGSLTNYGSSLLSDVTIGGALVANAATTLAGTTIGSLTVSGATTLAGSISVAGNVDCTGSVISRAAMYIEAGVYIKVGGDAQYDMYYREGPAASGYLARLPKGAANQFLRTNPGGWPEWRAADPLPAPTLAMGTPIVGGAHSQVLFNYNGAVGGGRLFFDYDSNCSLTVGEGTGNSFFTLNGAEGGVQAIHYSSVGRVRFQVGVNTAAAYGNANYYIVRCNDAGAAIGTHFMMVRSTGRILMGGINQPSADHLPGSVNIQPLSAGDYGLVIRRAGAQTQHLQAWQDEAGNNLSWITKDGVFSGAAGNVNWVNMNRTTSYSLGSNVNVGALFFYNTTLSGATPGGYLSFQYGLGATGGSLYMPLPVTGGTGITTGLTWLYRNGNNAPLAQTFEEYRHDSALGIVDNILAHTDVLDRLKAAILA